MTRGKKTKQIKSERRPAGDSRPGDAGRDRATWIVAGAGIVLAVAAAIVVAFAIRDSPSTGGLDRLRSADPGPIHVHGLGVNPADGALFIATHTGLYRVEEGEIEADRVGDLFQDTMGFTVAGPDRFLGSGHPDLREAREKGLPPHLGLIQSTDGGRTWDSVSLLGEADFHVLRHKGERVFGYDATNGRLMISADAGRTWTERAPPGSVVDIAVGPGGSRRLLVATAGGVDEGLFESGDDGMTWNRVNDVVGLLAWPEPLRMYLITGGGLVLTSVDGGRTLRRAGDIDGAPAAFLAESASELYVALHDGTVKRSIDGGRRWTVRSRP